MAFVLATGLACGAKPEGPAPQRDGESASGRPGLAWLTVPGAIRLNGRFQLRVSVSGTGDAGAAEGTEVTVAAAGRGRLTGTLTRRVAAGIVRFDDLRYDRWEPVTLTVRARGMGALSTKPIPVRPTIRFVEPPPYQVRSRGPLGPLRLELVDGRGALVEADLPVTISAPGLSARDGATRKLVAGRVTFDDVVLGREGPTTLSVTVPGLPPSLHGMTAFAARRTDEVWMPGARVNVPYRARLGEGRAFRLTQGNLPKGLKLGADGFISGVPTVAGHARCEIVSIDAQETARVWRVDLSVFGDDQADGVPRSVDELDRPGAFQVGTWDGTFVPREGAAPRALRVHYPVAAPGSAKPAPGRFPVVVFQHGVVPLGAGGPLPGHRFGPLLERWTSHGFVVASADALQLLTSEDRDTFESFNTLKRLSENQRGAIGYLRARDKDATFPLAGHMNLERVIVAGHSRGGAASLITLRADPTLVGGILLKPTDPLLTVGGERAWSDRLPPRPLLMVTAGEDVDVVYPLADFLYERRTGPMTAVTILGSVHMFTCGVGCPPEYADKPRITRPQDWSITNAYAVAFLNYAGRGDVRFAPLLYGPAALATRLSPLGVLVRGDRAASPLLVDDFQDGVEGRNALGLPNRTRGMIDVEELSWLPDSARRFEVENPFITSVYEKSTIAAAARATRLEWNEDGATFSSELDGADVRGRAAFVVRAQSLGDPVSPHKVTVRFVDGRGHDVRIKATGHMAEIGIGPRFGDLIVPVARIGDGGVDLKDLALVELILEGAGKILIDDLRFE